MFRAASYPLLHRRRVEEEVLEADVVIGAVLTRAPRRRR